MSRYFSSFDIKICKDEGNTDLSVDASANSMPMVISLENSSSEQNMRFPTNILACCRVGLPAADGGIVAAVAAT